MIDPTSFTWMGWLNGVALFCAIYTCAGAICRIRHSSHHMKPQWSLIYLAMASLGAIAAANIVTRGIDLWSCAVCIAIACYIHLTRAAWINGVPPIAQPDYVPEKYITGKYDRRNKA